MNKRTENAVTDERRLPTSYGRITVGGTARGAIEESSDVDIFMIRSDSEDRLSGEGDLGFEDGVPTSPKTWWLR